MNFFKKPKICIKIQTLIANRHFEKCLIIWLILDSDFRLHFSSLSDRCKVQIFWEILKNRPILLTLILKVNTSTLSKCFHYTREYFLFMQKYIILWRPETWILCEKFLSWHNQWQGITDFWGCLSRRFGWQEKKEIRLGDKVSKVLTTSCP